MKKSQPFFSIILPTYNRANFIEKAIESVLNQTYTNFELIIVDDGSTDNTEELVSKYLKPNIRYFKKNNEERNHARNFGINKSLGDYIAFLDSDDRYLTNHLEESSNLITENPTAKWFYLGMPSISHHSKMDTEYVRNALIRQNIFSINGIVIKRDIFNELSFLPSTNAIVSEDHYLWLRIAARYSLVLGKKPTSEFTVHSSRSLNKIDLNKLILGTDEIINALKHDRTFLDFFKEKANYYFAFRRAFTAIIANDNKDYSLTIKLLINAGKEDWRIVLSLRFLATLKNFILGSTRKLLTERIMHIKK